MVYLVCPVLFFPYKTFTILVANDFTHLHLLLLLLGCHTFAYLGDLLPPVEQGMSLKPLAGMCGIEEHPVSCSQDRPRLSH